MPPTNDRREYYNDKLYEIFTHAKAGDMQAAENALISLLIEILELHPIAPTRPSDEFQALEFTFWHWDKHYKSEPTTDPELSKKFPLNSQLLAITAKPALIQALLFQSWCYLHPQDPADYTQAELIAALKEYRRGKITPQIAEHHFDYHTYPSNKAMLKIQLAGGTLHILSY